MRRVIILFFSVLSLCCGAREARALQADDSLLRRQIGQMVIAGFRGFSVTDKVADAVQRMGIGGVIYFDRDVPSAVNRRNVRSPEQLEQLSAGLQRLAAEAASRTLYRR